MRDLGTLPGLPHSVANDLNERGEVVGSAFRKQDGFGDPLPFVWTRDAGMQPLPLALQGSWGEALAINERGEVVGEGAADPYDGGLFWSGGEVRRVLKSVDGSTAVDINHRSEIVGGRRGAYWVSAAYQSGPEAETQILFSASSESSDYAWAISNRGQVVGAIRRLAFTWQDGQLAFLARLSGYCNTSALDVNAAGQIVGRAWDAGCGAHGRRDDQRALLWENGVPRDLTREIPAASHWKLEAAHGINAAGQIVGVGTRILRGRRVRRAFLLTPR